MNEKFTKKEIQVINKYMKKFWPLLIINETLFHLLYLQGYLKHEFHRVYRALIEYYIAIKRMSSAVERTYVM